MERQRESALSLREEMARSRKVNSTTKASRPNAREAGA